MADQTKTYAQLIAEFPDNNQGLISPQDAHDFITTSFPYISTIDPNNNCDLVNTAGVPNATGFDTGNTWFNATSGAWWFCQAGTFGAALWVQIYPSVGGNDIFVARLSTGPLSATVLSTTLSASVLLSDSQITFANPGDYRKVGPAMAVPANGGFSAGCRTTRVNPMANSAESDTPADGNYSGPFTFTPDGYEWFEQQFDPNTGEPSDKVGGRSGTITTAPAVEINGAFGTQNDQVFMSLRETTTGGIPVYQFQAIALKPEGEGNQLTVGTVTVTDNIEETTITKNTVTTSTVNTVQVGVTVSIQFTPQGMPPTYPNSLWVDASGDLEYNDSSGNPQKISTGSVWHKFVVKYSDFPVSVGGTINLMSMGPYDVVSGCIWYISQTWVGSFTSTGLFFGYQDGNNPVSDHNTSAYGGQNVTLGGAPQTTLTLQSVFYGFNGQSQPGGVSWHLTATLGSAGGGTFTAGEVVVWFKVDSLPP